MTILIPAHNESGVIGRCVDSLIDSGGDGIEILIIPNGCTDRTAAVARSLGSAVRVIESPVASKSNALNLGDAAASGFPRFYVDADVVLGPGGVVRIVAALRQPGILAASPSVRHDFSGASWFVRAFYAIDRRLPSSREAIGGSGVYALSEEGRRRFGVFPDVIADDAFVRRQFTAAERVVVKDVVSIVTPPKTLGGLIKIKTRSHYGNYELESKFPGLSVNKGAENRSALICLALKPYLWPHLTVYGLVKIAARLRARRNWRSRAKYVWERDDSSRQASAKPNPAAQTA